MGLQNILIIALCFFGLEVSGRMHGWHHWRYHPLEPYLYPQATGYSSSVVPPSNGQPLEVEVNAYVRELGPLNLQENSYQTVITFRQKFVDARLKHSSDEPINILGEDVKKLWTPDTFFRNARQSQIHGSLHPNIYARVSPDGEVLMSQKMSIVASCADLLKNLREEGSATCRLDIASYGLTQNQLKYVWKKENPVQFGSETTSFLAGEVTMKDFNIDNCDAVTATGVYTCLRINFNFVKTV